jgi:chromate transporter
MLPAFVIMLALAIAYASLGVSPIMRGALYGLGPVVLGIFLAALYRLGRSTMTTVAQSLIAVGAATALPATPLGVAAILLLAGAVGLMVFHSKKLGYVVIAVIAAMLIAWWAIPMAPLASPPAAPSSPSLLDIATYFFKVGAFTVGGGLTMIAFIQDQVVEQFRWLTPREFVDGLALGQLTPGPVLMLAAYVGYKMAGLAGAAVAAGAAFLPSFILMLALLPMLDRVRKLTWTRAVMKGMGPAVIGVLAVSLLRLAPHAVPDAFAVAILVATVVFLIIWQVGSIRLMVMGSVLGIIRTHLLSCQASEPLVT